MDNWISVRDRLPEDTNNVLTYSYGKMSVAWYNAIHKAFYRYKIKRKSVTHWQPLPAPPVTDKNEKK